LADIARASDAHDGPSALPRSAVGHVFPVAVPADYLRAPLLQAVWSSLAFDYVARQKLSGTHLTYGIVKQLVCPTPAAFDAVPAWTDLSLREWLLPRVLELTYTSHRIAAYARDILGLDDDADPGPPFRWSPDRRELLRAELDAAMFHLYGLTRPEVEHVLDSFFVVRKYEERDHGEFRTRRLVLEIFDAMVAAVGSGLPYRTVLDPPPGHGPRHPNQDDQARRDVRQPETTRRQPPVHHLRPDGTGARHTGHAVIGQASRPPARADEPA
jgi:hypothetical protein